MQHNNLFVGMTSCIRASEEEKSFQIPFQQVGLDPNQILYLGESVLTEKYRGLGLGKLFFHEREKFGQSVGLKQFAFCCVVRPENHHLRPTDYKDLSTFWEQMGYQPRLGLTTSYDWKDLGENSKTQKLMQYWMKIVR